MKDSKLKTKCYYTDYINHAIRFYLSTPDGLNLVGNKYSPASIQNWNAVQLVFLHLDPMEKTWIKEIFGYGFHLPKSVEGYCKEKNLDTEEIWKLITRVSAKIARVRGLI